MMLQYGIGLDIGVSSVGWAVVALDENETPCGILGMGSRIFDAAEHPKTGASLAAPRREARSARRRLRRHQHRNQRIRRLIVSSGLLSKEALDALFTGKLEDIYALRVRALDEPVTEAEFARILIHLSQRRGFRSNRKNATSKEDGLLLNAVTANAERMESNRYRTVGEMLLRDPDFAAQKRNKGGGYLATVGRAQIEQEVKLLFAAQRSLGCGYATEDLEARYLEILLSQRSFDEGPGGNSPYGGSQIEKMVGKCTFYPEEPRAAKATYSFEYFSLLEKINHLRIVSSEGSLPLNSDQRQTLIALAHKTEALDFGKIRNALSIPESSTFNMVHYRDDSISAAEKKEKLGCMKAYHQMRKALDKVAKGRLDMLPIAQRNAIGTTLTLYKTSANIRKHLKNAGLEDSDIDAVEALSFSKFGHISLKACDAIISGLEQGMRYHEACTAAGLQFRGHIGGEKQMLLHPSSSDYEDLTSPVVRRAVSQTVKVINAIIRKQGGSPMFINIELAREMAKDFAERKKLEKEMEENRANNERIMERLRREYGILSPTGQDLVKFRLYQQQDGVCPYSQKQLSLQRLFEPNYAEIDHIIPYSISFDDSYKNKVLVFAEENRNKGKRLPLQYLTGKRRDDYIVWVNSSVKDRRKRQNLLKEAITKEDEEQFTQRNLTDTKTASVFLSNYIRDNLLFAQSVTGKKKRVTAVNGTITAYMRKRLGISKVRADGDIHHAVDALVIACTTDAMIRQISRHAAYRECRYEQSDTESYAVDPQTGEILRSFPHPWPQFRKELEAYLSSDPKRVIMDMRLPMYASCKLPLPQKPIFVSRMPRRKVSGAAHKDTVKSPKILDKGFVIVKRSLTDLKLKNGEIENYYNRDSDRLLYDALVARLTAFGGDGKKAFAEPFHKPKQDGTPGPIVKKVKLCEPTTLNVSVHGGSGVADNDSMVRVDVFYVEDDGYYLVPIYVADTLKPELPNRACVARKAYSEWKVMKDADFIFSLYPNDLIRITHRSSMTFGKNRKESTLSEKFITKTVMAYYQGTNIASSTIECITHNNAYTIGSLGVKTLESLEKYTVDVLGEYHKVEKEKRMPFTMK